MAKPIPAPALYLLRHAAEECELRARIRLIIRARLVGHGEVSVYSLRLKPRQSAGADDIIHTLVKMRAVHQKAEAGHAGVELDMYFQRAAKLFRRGGSIQAPLQGR